ncbi:MAG TPA: BON domain-containing protein [Polyangiaceae bacterium]|jgi:osmotically-inducible protein OsmY
MPESGVVNSGSFSEPTSPSAPPAGPAYRDPNTASNTFATGRAPDVNSAVGQQDGSDTATPADHGQGESEADISEGVRRSILADKSLSAVAKNVRVTTMGNKVTLRGTVNTNEEKKAIERIARASDGVRDVTNLLQVNE